MTDIEIIELLEKELSIMTKVEITMKGSFQTDENGNVTSVDIAYLKLTEIPTSLLKLKNLKTLYMQETLIVDITPLLKLKKLQYLDCTGCDKIDTDSFIRFLEQGKQLKYVSFFISWSFKIFPREALNHNLTLNTNHDRDYLETCLNMDGYGEFPPLPMLELGYRNPQFYYNNYLYELIDKYKRAENSNNYDRNKNSRLNQIKNEIISELLNRYYKKYKKKNELPYSIRKISIYYFYEIEELLIDYFAINKETKEINDPHWIFITGENGYGKSLLLRAIIIGLFGDKDGNAILTNEGDFYLEFTNNKELCVNTVGSNFNENFVSFQKFAAYGPARLNKSPRPFNDSKTNSLFNSVGELLDIEERLIAWEKDDGQESYFNSAKEILENLLKPQIKEIIIDRKGTETTVKYIEFKGDNKREFKELASGYRSVISMIGDIIIRLSKHQPEIKDFKELAGIVIIDEIDLHLHPKWQKTMIEKLTILFPKIQFIVSTHSPIPILGAPENTVIINIQRTENKGITAKKLDIDVSKLTPNSILTSPVFGFEDINSNEADIDEIETADIYSNVEAEKRMKAKLRILKQNDEDFFNSLKVE